MASWAVLGLFAAVLATALFVPVYTDEITIKIARVQVLSDGFRLASLFPQCGADFALPVPPSWRVSALLDRGIYGGAASPGYLRIIGIATLVAWLGLLAWHMRANTRAQVRTLHLLAGLAAVASLGITPYLLALNRSEQVLVVGLSLVCLLPFLAARHRFQSSLGWLLLTALFLVMVSYMFWSHPKAVFFVPLMLTSAIILAITSRRGWVWFVLLGGVGWVSVESTRFWIKRMYCPDAPFLDEILKSHSLSLGSLFTSPMEFMGAGLHNLIGFKEYVRNILFQVRYQSDWLPQYPGNKLDIQTAMINMGVKVAYVVFIGYTFVLLVRQIRCDWRERKLSARTFVPATLFFGIGVTSFLMVSKNFYESSLILPLMFLLFVLLFQTAPVQSEGKRPYGYVFAGLLAISILSQLNLLRTFAGHIPRSWMEGGQVKEQALSISSYGYAQEAEKIIAAADKCGIKREHSKEHLVIDDSTYFVFKEAHQPFHAAYLGGFFGRDIGDKNLLLFLNRNGSAGVITRCEKLSPEIRRYATGFGNYCCIGQQEIRRSGGGALVVGE
jgi:hypothetical protein